MKITMILTIIIIIIFIYLIYEKYNIKHFTNSYDNTQINELNKTSKPYLWQYWEGNMPDYISLCMETVDNHCSKDFNIIRLNKQNIQMYLPEIKQYNDKINKLIIPHQVDIYRIMLLYKYGGIYMDADVIVLRNPIEIINKLKEFDFVGFGCTGEICTYG